MKIYRFFWGAHKWTGVVLALVVAHMAVTGFLLLIKKDYEWIQPATRTGSEGELRDFISMDRLFSVVFAQNDERFRTLDDIDRVDFRPGRRVHKVHSKHEHAEIQVDAVSGEVLNRSWRPSDLFESLHDGSFYAGWIHGWFMPVVAVGLLFLSMSGLYLWLSPLLRKRARRRRVRRRRGSS